MGIPIRYAGAPLIPGTSSRTPSRSYRPPDNSLGVFQVTSAAASWAPPPYGGTCVFVGASILLQIFVAQSNGFFPSSLVEERGAGEP